MQISVVIISFISGDPRLFLGFMTHQIIALVLLFLSEWLNLYRILVFSYLTFFFLPLDVSCTAWW